MEGSFSDCCQFIWMGCTQNCLWQQAYFLIMVMDGALVSSSSSSSAAAPAKRWTYDVFLSFRGEDTRNNFVDHLYSALDHAGIYTFKDDEKLQRGNSISPGLVTAIQESMVAVVVFSKNYANSCWCLDELVKIIECQDLMGQKVLPVFYDVEPSDVRGQKRSFYTAFQQHEVKSRDDMEKQNRWRDALVTAANLSGWDVSRTANGREAECIKQIVRHILSYIESRPAENLIGMESRVRHVKSLLCKGVDDVYMIGIWGMGGIGKTTIARAVYHQVSYEFDGSSFVEDVRENGTDKRGLKSLQEKLLSEILMQEHFKLKDCDDGVSQIRRRLGRKKVFVVLDDVDSITQLEFLAGAHEWFGPGSRILVTTRDEHLLCYAQKKYAPELLKPTEAMRLFSRYAFKANTPSNGYEVLSDAVVTHTGYLPLALKVLGSYFCGRNLEFWQSALNILAKKPNKEINGILKLSYDCLDDFEKEIFLHIACLFKGKKRYYVTRILDSLGLEAVRGITVLIEKSFMTISNGYIHMHDLIQEMGLCIGRECFPDKIVWAPEEIKEVVTNVTKLENVEAIVEKDRYFNERRPVPYSSAEVFKRMKKLRLLQVKGGFTFSEPTHFPEQLRWLCLVKYPFQSLRITRGMAKLVGLEIQEAQIKQLEIEKKVTLTNLKFMILSGSSAINSFPDVSGVPNLESLNLSYCSRLVEVHRSVLLHEKIINLNLNSCYNLKRLPPIIKMKSLQTLHLMGCMHLERLPEISRETRRLLLLNISGCGGIMALPSSTRLLTALTILDMGNGMELPFGKENFFSKRILPNELDNQDPILFISLRILDLRMNNLVEDDFSTNLHNVWPSLEELVLSRNVITRLPASISQLSHLKYLNLSCCINLKELCELPSLIQFLKADNCKYLEKIGDLSSKCRWLFKISLYSCPKLLEDQESQSYLTNMLMKSLVQKCAAVNHQLSIAVPGSKIPNWFTKQQLVFHNKIVLNLPKSQITRVKGLALCFLLRLNWPDPTWFEIKFNTSNEEVLIVRPQHAAKTANHVWIGYMSITFLENLCDGFESEYLILSVNSCLNDLVECGLCVVYKDDVIPMTEIGSWIPDYDDSGKINHYCVDDEDFQHGRWSQPSLSYGKDRPGAHNSSVHVEL